MVTEYAYPVLGGISEHVHFLSRELVALGHDVTVLTGNAGSPASLRQVDRDAERDHGYTTRRIGRAVPIAINGSIARSTLLAMPWAMMRRQLRGADVVHAQGLVGPVMPLLAAAVSEAPVTVGTFHTYVEGGQHWAYRLMGWYVRRVLPRLDRRIAVSDACVDGLMGSFPGCFDVIPNGVDCERFHPIEADGARPDGPPRILFVGRLEPRNALNDLIHAAAQLAASGYDFVVQVAGDGPTRGVNERLAQRLGVADRIEWLGLIHDDLPKRYREATLLAAPCTLASFGVILIEALASGTPIVCADNVGFRQVIRDGAPGRFVPMRDPDALAVAIGDVLDDAALRSEWAALGRQIATERYDWPRVALRVEALYREIAAGDLAAGALVTT
jgi:phosphatidyl-myo-inositol alpha-mannosyltransferase